MWVSEPEAVSELGSLDDDSPPTFTAAALQCDPYYADWGNIGTVHICHEGIIPGGQYALQAIEWVCSPGDENSFSTPLALTAGTWGDVVGVFDETGGVWTGPDGSIDVTSDIVAVLDKLGSRPGSPTKPRVDVEPATPDMLINISDVVQMLDAYRGLPYPFEPGPDPCP